MVTGTLFNKDPKEKQRANSFSDLKTDLSMKVPVLQTESFSHRYFSPRGVQNTPVLFQVQAGRNDVF